MCFCFELCQEFNNVWVMALSQNAALSLDYLSLSWCQFKILNNFNCHFFVCFFIFASEDIRKITTANSLEFYELLENRILFIVY